MSDLDEHGNKIPGSAQPLSNKCGAKLRYQGDLDPRKGRFCTRSKGFGTPHLGTGACKFHGGSVRSHIKKAEVEKVKNTVTRLQKELGKPTTLKDPYVELWDLTADVKQWYEISRDLMAELESADPSVDRTGLEHTRELIAMFERAQIMLRDTLLAIAKLDLQRRLVELEEDQARIIGRAVMDVIEDHELGLTDDQMDYARHSLGVSLSKLAPSLKPAGIPNMATVEAAMAEIVDEDE